MGWDNGTSTTENEERAAVQSSGVTWQDPPEHQVQRIFSAQVVEELRANPGRWALIRRYERSRGRRAVKHPVDIEVRWCYVGGRGKVAAELYARATGEV